MRGLRGTLAALVVLGASGPARAQWQKNEYQLDKARLARFEPVPLVVQRRSNREPQAILRIRFYADDDFRTGSGAWQDQLRAQLLDLNRITEPAFLHEWAHTLGALHLEDPTSIMGPGYSQRTSALSREEGDLLAAGLEARLASRGKEAIDWTPLREFLVSSRSPGWRPEERQAL